MTITLDEEIEQRMELIAARRGQDAEGYVRMAILRQITEDERAGQQAWLRQEFASAVFDPLFIQDNSEIEEAFLSADSETARKLSDD